MPPLPAPSPMTGIIPTIWALEKFACHSGLVAGTGIGGIGTILHHPQPVQTHFQTPLGSYSDLAQRIRMLRRGLRDSKREAESTASFLCSHQPALVEPPLLGTWGCQGAFVSICRVALTCARPSVLGFVP